MTLSVSSVAADSPTRAQLLQALLSLMADHPFAAITVQQITRSAGLARQTFYLHYRSREDLLLDYVDSVFAEFYDDIADMVGASPELDSDISQRLFEQWNRHRDFSRLIFSAGLESLLIKRFQNYIARVLGLYVRQHGIPVSDAEQLGFMIDYLAGASWMMLDRWVRNDFRYPAEKLASLFSQLSRPGFLDVMLQRPQ
ncbi:MAG: hypothetical protein COB09_10560 [Thalassobium sp.]|nr:MAG: hypothetical protein COB09_10560 [Thalassobium sp.]